MIRQLQAIQAARGDMKVFTGDMKPVALGVEETMDPEDFRLYGQDYLFIVEGV
ncbi:hypothetical protein [Geomonas sp. Red32]|uniref:hypothetical protein n=1 Tax=Geomonas sp. Red32 TaxID=2912856 RepID=UPI00202D0673|nr:hypothetical protein [Geomonas sp. Red32]